MLRSNAKVAAKQSDFGDEASVTGITVTGINCWRTWLRLDLVLRSLAVGFALVFVADIAHADSGENVRTVYVVDLTDAARINVSMRVAWQGLQRIELYPFEEANCALNVAKQPTEVSGGSWTTKSNGLIEVRPINGVSSLSVLYSFAPSATTDILTQQTLEQCLPMIRTGDFFLIDGKRVLPFIKFFNASGERIRLGATRIDWRLPHRWQTAGSVDGQTRIDDATSLHRVFVGGIVRRYSAKPLLGEKLQTFGSKGAFPAGSAVHDAVVSARQHFTSQLWPLNTTDEQRSAGLMFVRSGADPGESLFGLSSTGVAIVFYSAGFNLDRDQILAEEVAVHELVHWWMPLALVDRPTRIPLWIREGIPQYLAFDYVSHRHQFTINQIAARVNAALASVAADQSDATAYDRGFLAGIALDHSRLPDPANPKKGVAKALRTVRSLVVDGAIEPDSAAVASLFSPTFAMSKDCATLPTMPSELVFKAGRLILTRAQLPRYETGFEVASSLISSGRARIERVEPNGPAERAGIKQGESLLAVVSGGNNNVHEPLVLLIGDASGVSRKVSFWPHGELETMPTTFYMPASTSIPASEESSLCSTSAN